MSFFSRGKKLEEKKKKLLLKEKELVERERVEQKEAILQERHSKVLREEAQRKLSQQAIAIEELKLEAEAKKARRAADGLRRNAAAQGRLRIEAEEKLYQQQQRNSELERSAAEQQSRLDYNATKALEEERLRGTKLQEELEQVLEEQHRRHQEGKAEVRSAEQAEAKLTSRVLNAQKELESRLQQVKMRQQRDEVCNFNSPKALRELRELIRTRHELDMEIWRRRDDLEVNRPIIEKLMIKSDGILEDIQSRAQVWRDKKGLGEEESGWKDDEVELVEELIERLLSDGKREWMKQPPWPEKTGKQPRRFRTKQTSLQETHLLSSPDSHTPANDEGRHDDVEEDADKL